MKSDDTRKMVRQDDRFWLTPQFKALVAQFPRFSIHINPNKLFIYKKGRMEPEHTFERRNSRYYLPDGTNFSDIKGCLKWAESQK